MFTPSIWFFVLRAMATDRILLRVIPNRRFLIGYGQPDFWMIKLSHAFDWFPIFFSGTHTRQTVHYLVWTSHSFLKWFWLHFFGGRGDLHPLFCYGTISFRKAFTIIMYFVYRFPVRIAVNKFADWNKEDFIAFLMLFYDIVTIDYSSHFLVASLLNGIFLCILYRFYFVAVSELLSKPLL